ATIFNMSVDEKARSDSVRMLPSALRLRLSAVAESSSGASMTITMSYRPCVQKYILNGHSERLRHLPEGLCPLRRIFSVFDALIGERGKHDIGCHGRFP